MGHIEIVVTSIPVADEAQAVCTDSDAGNLADAPRVFTFQGAGDGRGTG